jgi:Protein of unknown function (DUF3306)
MADRDRRLPTGADADEGFLRRWSRRKTEARSAAVAAPPVAEDPVAEDPDTATPPAAPQGLPDQDAPAPVDPADLPDIDSLDATSDFSVFMRPGVPAHLRTLALRKLWRSDPIFSKLDGLVEYGEDYTLASWPKGTIKTAYQIGRGFVKQLEKLEGGEAEPGPEPPIGSTPPEPAPALGAPTDEPSAGLAQLPQPVPEPAGSDEVRPAPQPTRAKTPAKRGGRARQRRGRSG